MNKEITYEDYKTALKIVKGFECQIINLNSDFIDSINKLRKLNTNHNEVTPDIEIIRSGLPLRTSNRLYATYGRDTTIRQLSKIPMREIKLIRGIGKKSKQEIINLFNNVGLSYIN